MDNIAILVAQVAAISLLLLVACVATNTNQFNNTPLVLIKLILFLLVVSVTALKARNK